jgi:COP9 signalosome complex subunit 2
MGSEIDPFDSQETKPYKTNPQIKAVTDLVTAYQRKEVHEAEKILRENQSTFTDDPFIKSYIGDLLRALRTQYLIALIKPYTRLDLSFLARVSSFLNNRRAGSLTHAQQLNIDKAEVEEILIGLILEGKVDGRIDQVAQRLELDKQCVPFPYLQRAGSLKFISVKSWKREGIKHWTNGPRPWRVFILPL